jgi:predicted RNA binding protein YcfA (HicA-like mRNA interferase family)
MPSPGPIRRKDLIHYLRELGFDGPYGSGRHQFMIKDRLRLFVPNPHEGDIDRGLLLRILKQGGIDRDEWEKL